MPFELLAWAIGYTAKKGADYSLDALSRGGLGAKMQKAAEDWNAALPEELRLNNPAGLFQGPLKKIEQGERVALDELRGLLDAGHIPEPEVWVMAFQEQVRGVRKLLGDGAVAFVCADDATTLPHLMDLANRLTRVMKTDSDTVLPAMYDLLQAMTKRVSEMELQIANRA